MTDFPEKVRALLKREGTKISWADLTFNPWIGCQAVSPACANCYAAELAQNRLGVTFGPGEARKQTADSTWAKPWRWDRVAGEAGVKLRVFCASLADWADNAVPDEWRARLANMISGTPNLIWMLLTKRIGNARAMLERMFPEGVPANVWLGITVVNQQEADRDVPRALSLKAGLRISRLFLSMEPLLAPVDLKTIWLRRDGQRPNDLSNRLGDYVQPLRGNFTDSPRIDMVIVGGESGRDARPLHPVWVDNLQMDCADAGVAFHFKQWGEFTPWQPGAGREPVWASSTEAVIRTSRAHPNDAPMIRVGTARAGRTLRGKEYQEMAAC